MRLIIAFSFFVLLLSCRSIQGTLIVEGNIYIFRSQYIEHTIVIDGNIDDTEWAKAGRELILLNNGNLTRNLFFQFTNNEEYFYIGASLDIEDATSVEFTLVFDTDGDGALSAPEDGKTLNMNNQMTDLHWDGSKWSKDLSDLNADEFLFFSKNDDQKVYFEMRFKLISSYIQYDGWQIATPSNTFIGLTTQTKLIEGNSTNYFVYPSSINNATGYVDLKLAGPEDQDIQAYVPESGITQTAQIPDVNDIVDVLGVDAVEDLQADAPLTIGLLSISMLAMILLKRRRE
ncbi:MAG: hypothetical protein GPJ54_10040 [Candidatus Heimdallarchaeota archaeon]|nr:hypothetical protein [Candidatus Heimdallarchaeota archaeon]